MAEGTAWVQNKLRSFLGCQDDTFLNTFLAGNTQACNELEGTKKLALKVENPSGKKGLRNER